jgi:hypothetical protein
VTGQAVNEIKSLLSGPSSVAEQVLVLPTNNLLFTSSLAEDSAENGVLSHRRECEEVAHVGNALRARVQSRRMQVEESDKQHACDMGRGELDSERIMMPSESSDGDHLLMEVRKDAVDIFERSSSSVSQAEKSRGLEDREFLKALEELEAHIMSLRKWNRNLLSSDQISDNTQEWHQTLRKMCDDIQNSTRLLGRVLVSPQTSKAEDATQTVEEDQDERGFSCGNRSQFAPSGAQDGIASLPSTRYEADRQGGTGTNLAKSRTTAADTNSQSPQQMLPTRTRSWGERGARSTGSKSIQILGRTESDRGKKAEKGVSRIGSTGKKEISSLETNTLTRGTKNQPFRNSDGCTSFPRPEPSFLLTALLVFTAESSF